ENYSISGYSPALLNGTRVNLMIVFDNDHPYGFIAGAAPVYVRGETEAQAKNLIGIGEGDVLQFLCEYYDYDGKFQDSYRLGDPLTLGAETEIANTPIGDGVKKVTYCFTDFYQQRYWTPARIY
ncbi:MAG: peptidase C11, partial [Clostridia bacterium]|nr:peptidase C11 [Clostridia bacterium]